MLYIRYILVEILGRYVAEVTENTDMLVPKIALLKCRNILELKLLHGTS